jgi:hypothetical protein
LETSGSPSRLATRITWSLVGLFAVSYAMMFAWFSPLALQDLPNHLARARIVEDLLFQHGAQFGTQFELHLLPIPYLLGDVVLATTTRIFGITVAAMCWTMCIAGRTTWSRILTSGGPCN